MSAEIAERIRGAIAERGPISFAEFMDLALYGQGGFYDDPPVGRVGDFVTSPHIHWWFAYAVAKALGELHEALGDPSPARVVEVGAGDGTLARTLLDIVRDAGPVDYVAVERSAGAIELLRELPVRTATALDDVAPIRDATVFANELLDNLPFRRVRRRDGGLVEVRIDALGHAFVEREVPAEEDLRADAGSAGGHDETIVPTGALAFIDELARVCERSYVLLIDYAEADVPSSDRVHGYRDHRVVADVLSNPGTTDITAGVNLDAVAARASADGLDVLGRVSQRDALVALGFRGWAERQRERQASLLADGRDVEATRCWESRSRATLLLEPAGLGRLSWLLLATPGLPRPPWLELAAEEAV
ncbi:MAG TPA: SAM-dependent methyltransferase [Actinomycetota bacterium]|nr:SAM-dependent methyltransferase [Actinomycetota bacterium]